jgi:hypothetical protein
LKRPMQWCYVFIAFCLCVVRDLCVIFRVSNLGYAVVQLVEALRYKPKGHRFDS